MKKVSIVPDVVLPCADKRAMRRWAGRAGNGADGRKSGSESEDVGSDSGYRSLRAVEEGSRGREAMGDGPVSLRGGSSGGGTLV